MAVSCTLVIMEVIMTEMEYVIHSIETNLFFLRIIKEHLIFTIAALTQRDKGMIPQISGTIEKLEDLLEETIRLANGVIPPQALMSGDIISPYTLQAEMTTQYLTGIKINTNITRMEAAITNSTVSAQKPMLARSVDMLNQRIIGTLKSVIQAKKTILNNVLSCKMFTTIYPLMLDHVAREAEHYMEHLTTLQSNKDLMETPKDVTNMKEFWDNIMGEHAKFIRGLLDPSEEALINKADGFAHTFTDLTNDTKQVSNNQMYDQEELLHLITRNIDAVTDIRDFKEEGTRGIIDCRIKSIILPLLSDHVLRETNHFLKELKMIKF